MFLSAFLFSVSSNNDKYHYYYYRLCTKDMIWLVEFSETGSVANKRLKGVFAMTGIQNFFFNDSRDFFFFLRKLLFIDEIFGGICRNLAFLESREIKIIFSDIRKFIKSEDFLASVNWRSLSH